MRQYETIANVRATPKWRCVNEGGFPLARIRRDEGKANRRKQSDSLYWCAVGKGIEQRRQPQYARVRIVVDVFLRASLSERAGSDDRTAVVRGDRSREHFGCACGIAIHESSQRSAPPVHPRRLRSSEKAWRRV
jgi:hypothetical protein